MNLQHSFGCFRKKRNSSVYVRLSEALERVVNSGVPEGCAHFQIALYNSIADGNEGNVSNDLEDLIGRKPTSIRALSLVF